jgi:hypothetical protein
MGNVFKKPGGAPSQTITNSNQNAKMQPGGVLKKTEPVSAIVTPSPEIQSLQAKSNELRNRIESASNSNKPNLQLELNNVEQKLNSLKSSTSTKINGGRSKKSKRKRRKSVRR